MLTAPTDVYWAAETGLELAVAAHERVRHFYSELPKRIMYQRWAKARRTFYGLSGQEDPFDISRPGVAGDEGQLTSIRVNHAGAILRRSVGQVSQSIPEFEPVPTNSDYESIAQSQFCRKLLDYFMDTKQVGARLYDTALGAAIDGEAVLEVAWDAKAGPKLTQTDPMLPNRTNAGDLVFRTYAPIDLPCDLSRMDQEHDWRITRRYVNRFDVAARYPGLAQDILNLRAESQPQSTSPTDRLQQERQWGKDKSDLIPLYTLYHRITDCMPNGKIAEFLSSDIMLYEGNLPYSEVPLVQISPGKILRSPYGESQFHHLLALQDIYDMLASSVASNNAALALHLIFMPEELDFSHMEFSEGFAVIRGGGGPSGNAEPKVLNFNAPNDVALKFMEAILDAMRLIGGVSATQMGAPPPNVRSGEFGALISQFALEFNSTFQYSFQQAVAKTGNLIVSILKQYADQPIVAQIVGETNDYQRIEFTKAKLENIERVVVKSGNPAARTPQFNIAMASDLLAKNVITDVKTYVTLVRTGQADVMIDDAMSDDMRMRRENEMLAKGQKPTMVLTDPHREEIQFHKAVLSSPAARSNPQVVGATLDHIQEHLDALRDTDPQLLAILGQPSLAAPLVPPAGGAVPAAAHPPTGPDQGPRGPSGPPPPAPPKIGGGGPLPMPSSHPPQLPPSAAPMNGAH